MRWSTLQSFLARSKNPYIWHHYYVHLDKWDLMRWLISQSRAQNIELFVCCMKSLHVITNFVQRYIERKHSANLPIFLRYSCLPNLCFRYHLLFWNLCSTKPTVLYLATAYHTYYCYHYFNIEFKLVRCYEVVNYSELLRE